MTQRTPAEIAESDRISAEMAGWVRDCAEEHMRWLRGVQGITDEEKLQACWAGFEAGWRKAISVARLHGYMK